MLVNLNNIILVLILMLVVVSIDVSFLFHNKKYIDKLLINEFKNEELIYKSRLALFAYILPVFLLLYLLFMLFAQLMFDTFMFYLQVFLIFVLLYTFVIIKSIFVIMTDKRIMKFSTLKLFFVQTFNIEYKDIIRVTKNDFFYDSSIYITDMKQQKYRIDGEIDASKIYSLLTEKTEGGLNE